MAISSDPPLAPGWQTADMVEGQADRGGENPFAELNRVSPSYFRTMGVSPVRGRDFLPVAVIAAGWGAGALIAAASAMTLLDPATGRFMDGFWREGFPPAWSQPLAVLAWLPRQLFWAFAHFLVFLTPLPLVLLLVVPLAIVAAIGLPALVRSHSWQTAILSTPIVAGVAAAVAGLLPFRHRLALHAAWPILVFAMSGLQRVESWLRASWPRLAPAAAPVAAVPLLLVVLLAARPPYDSGQETRPIIEELARHWKAGDGMYVYCGARHCLLLWAAPRSLRVDRQRLPLR